jgi:hypothetical protein
MEFHQFSDPSRPQPAGNKEESVRIQGRYVRRALVGVAVASGIALAAAVATPASASTTMMMVHPRVLATFMDGANDVPAVDTEGFGISVVLVIPAMDEVCYVVTQHDLSSTVIAAHIHKGAKGTNGPVVVPFTAPVNGKARGCTTVADALAKDLAANPDNYYVNVHTTNHPAGEIRGQLR